MNQVEARQIELIEAESSARQFHAEKEHHERMYFATEQFEYGLFALLKPNIMQDGNQWCVLYGDDLQVGIAGFGDTPFLAIMDWRKQWHKPLPPAPEDNNERK